MEGWLGAGITFRLDPGIISECIKAETVCCFEGEKAKQRDPGINK